MDQQLRRLYVSDLPKYAQLNCVIHGPYHKDVEEMVTRYGKNWRILESIPDGRKRSLCMGWVYDLERRGEEK